VYCAPQTGGESFGIVLVEAMSAGAAVVASDLGAFRRVLDDGTAGALFRTGDSRDLSARLVEVLDEPEIRAARAAHAAEVVRQYDWSSVTRELLAVYEMVLDAHGHARVGEDPSSLRGRARDRWRTRDEVR